MSQKEKVSIVRSDDFVSVDADLTDAMEHLDAANARIFELLEPGAGEPAVPAVEGVADAAPEDDASEAKKALKEQAEDGG